MSTRMVDLSRTLFLLCLLGAFAASPLSAGKPPSPAERTYFAVFIGLTGPYSQDPACLRFTGNAVCFNELCGVWERRPVDEPMSRETAFSLDFELSPPFGGGIGAFVHGHGRTDRNGRKSAIGGAAVVQPKSLLASPDNISFAGRRARPKRCAKMRDSFQNREAIQ